MRAALATAELAEAVGPVEGVEVSIWNGDGPPPEGEVVFWVPHYATRADVIDRGHLLQGLRVVQLQSAGYDGVAERLPAGITLCNATGVHDDATAEHAVPAVGVVGHDHALERLQHPAGEAGVDAEGALHGLAGEK